MLRKRIIFFYNFVNNVQVYGEVIKLFEKLKIKFVCTSKLLGLKNTVKKDFICHYYYDNFFNNNTFIFRYIMVYNKCISNDIKKQKTLKYQDTHLLDKHKTNLLFIEEQTLSNSYRNYSNYFIQNIINHKKINMLDNLFFNI